MGHCGEPSLTFSIFRVFFELLLGSRASTVALVADIFTHPRWRGSKIGEVGTLAALGVTLL